MRHGLPSALEIFDSVVIDAAISGGVTDTVALRFACKWDYQGEGFYHNSLSGNDIGDTNTFSSRTSVHWLPIDEIEIYFNFHIGHDRSENHPWVAVGTSDPTIPAANPAYPGGQIFSSNCASSLTTPISYFSAKLCDKKWVPR